MTWIQLTSLPDAGELERVIAHRGCLWSLRDAGNHLYDPRADRWSWINFTFHHRRNCVVSPIGDDLLVWSGMYQGQRIDATDPDNPIEHAVTKTKQPTVRTHARCAWTGRELLVWGGMNQRTPRLDGAAYDPALDKWRRLPKEGAATTYNGAHVWTGNEFWIWGGSILKRGKWVWLVEGFAYDPAANTWRALASLPGQPRSEHGYDIVRVGDAALLVRRDDDRSCSAWRYEPRSDLWEPCAPPPTERDGAPKFVTCGDRIFLIVVTEVFEYVVMSDTWVKLPTVPSGPARLLELEGTLLAIAGATVYRLANASIVAPWRSS